MKPGFMSSVYPQQTLQELIATAQKHGYQGIEFRVEWDHKHGVELDATPEQLQAARRKPQRPRQLTIPRLPSCPRSPKALRRSISTRPRSGRDRWDHPQFRRTTKPEPLCASLPATTTPVWASTT